MRYRDRVADLASRMGTLPDAGAVHTGYQRVKDWGVFIEQFTVDDPDRPGRKLVQGICVTRQSRVPSGMHWIEGYQVMVIDGCDEKRPEAEPYHHERADAVMAYWTENTDLAWGCVPMPPELADVEIARFGSVLCHVSYLQLQVLSHF